METHTARAENTLLAEVRRVAEAMDRGDLDVRGLPDGLSPDEAAVIMSVNATIDTLVKPLRVAAGSIRQISVGSFPDFIIDDYRGEFNEIKKSVNTFLAVMYGMHNETRALVDAIRRGRLDTRGNDWDFEGAWRDLIGGINATLDAVVDPIREASQVLERLARYELCARVDGRYRGDHARIKRSLNATADALHDAISQVATAVGQVSSVGQRIAEGSQVIAGGASVQVAACAETAATLGRIGDVAQHTLSTAEDARRVAEQARSAGDDALAAMSEMAAVMKDICTSAENTAAIISEINDIAAQTDELADGASREATEVGTSGRGFTVVADEVRKLAIRSKDAAQRMRNILDDHHSTVAARASDRSMLDEGIQEIERVALQSNMLALNAAVEAAHVETAGRGFQRLTGQVRNLAGRAKGAAERTEALTTQAVGMAQAGAKATGDVEAMIARSQGDIERVATYVEQAASAARQQADEVNVVSGAMAKMQQVATDADVEAGRSYDMAGELERQTTTLQTLVNRFDLGKPVART